MDGYTLVGWELQFNLTADLWATLQYGQGDYVLLAENVTATLNNSPRNNIDDFQFGLVTTGTYGYVPGLVNGIAGVVDTEFSIFFDNFLPPDGSGVYTLVLTTSGLSEVGTTKGWDNPGLAFELTGVEVVYTGNYVKNAPPGTPEPATMLILLGGMGALPLVRRFRKK